MAQIGDRRQDGKIYAGPDYGYQSAQSFDQLKQDGAFKLGASAVRRTVQAIGGVMKYTPQPLKDFAKWYSESGQRENQRYLDRGFTQQQIDAANAEKQKYSKYPDATQKFLGAISDKTNVAPEIINAGAAIVETAVSGRLGKTMAKSTLTGAANNVDAPVAHAGFFDRFKSKPQPEFTGGQVKLSSWKPVPERKTGLPLDPKGGRVPSPQRTIREDGTQTKWRRNEDGSFTLDVLGEPETITASDGSTFTTIPAGIEPKPRSKFPPPPKEIPRELPGGSTRQTPQSQAQFNESPDGQRRQRQFVEERDTGEWLPDEQINTSDMARPVSDGNQRPIGDRNPDVLVPAKERNRQFKAGVDQRAKNAIDARIQSRKQELDIDNLRTEVFFSGDDYGKLKKIASDLGVPVSKYKAASSLERAINKKLNDLENVYAGKSTLSVKEQKEIIDDVKYATATGRTQAEVNLLNKRAPAKAKKSPGRIADTRVKASTDPDPIRSRQRPYGQPETKAGDFDYDTQEKLIKQTAKKDLEFYKERYLFDEKTQQFLLDEEGAYIPRKAPRSVSGSAAERINRRRQKK